MAEDLRWTQRFRNFDRAARLLRESLAGGVEALNPLEQEGTVHRFELALELAWKTLKDFLQSEGEIIQPVTPRAVVKAGFAAGVLPDGQVWIDMLDHRNLLAHTYDETTFQQALLAIRDRYLPAIEHLHAWLRERGGP